MTVLPPERKCPKCGAYSNTSDVVSCLDLAGNVNRMGGKEGILPTDEYCIYCGTELQKHERRRPKIPPPIKKMEPFTKRTCKTCGHSETTRKAYSGTLMELGKYCPECGSKLSKQNLTIEEVTLEVTYPSMCSW